MRKIFRFEYDGWDDGGALLLLFFWKGGALDGCVGYTRCFLFFSCGICGYGEVNIVVVVWLRYHYGHVHILKIIVVLQRLIACHIYNSLPL